MTVGEPRDPEQDVEKARAELGKATDFITPEFFKKPYGTKKPADDEAIGVVTRIHMAAGRFAVATAARAVADERNKTRVLPKEIHHPIGYTQGVRVLTLQLRLTRDGKNLPEWCVSYGEADFKEKYALLLSKRLPYERIWVSAAARVPANAAMCSTPSLNASGNSWQTGARKQT